jgi:O-methyltransferase
VNNKRQRLRVKLIAKSAIQRIANTFGYEVHRLRTTGTQQSVIGEYTDYYHLGQRYSPWWQSWFRERVSKLKGKTLVSEDRLYIIYCLCLNCTHLDGDYAECGVYKGGTAFLIADTIADSVGQKRLHLFDTFTGMPNTACVERMDAHKAGDFADTDFNNVKSYLSAFPFIVFHPGFFPETFSGVNSNSFCFVHIDVDIYQSAWDCCEFFYQRLVKGGIMVFDDYGFPTCKGERFAVDEFFKDKHETPVTLPTGQCLVLKL